MIVLVSAVIVTGYFAWPMLIKAPEIPDTTPATPVSDTSQEETPLDPNALVRREGVYNFLLLGSDKGGGNADTIIVVSYDTKGQKVGVLSIPRDSIVDRDWSRNAKLNAALGHGGPELVAEEVTQMLGIPIDYYFHVNLQGFVALVDELDGVDINIPVAMNYDDPYQNLHIHFKPGLQHLDGQETMEAVRYRHDNNTDVNPQYSDLDRTKLQQEVLTQLAQKVLSWQSITKIQSFLNIFNTYVKTNMDMTQMLYFAQEAMGLDTANGVTSATLEGRGDAYYAASSWCMELDQATTVERVNQLVNPYTRDLTLEDMNLPRADRYYFSY